jgi:hypothetical protein
MLSDKGRISTHTQTGGANVATMRRLGVCVVSALLLTACGGGSAAESPPETTSPAPETSTSTTAASPAPSTGSPNIPLPPEITATAATTSCQDAAGDSNGALDLTGVTVEATGDGVRVTFTWTGEVPTTGTAFWSAILASADGETVRQVGYEILDAHPIASRRLAKGHRHHTHC